MMIKHLIVILICVAPLLGCSDRQRLQPYSEVVMSPGTQIKGTNANGTVVITAGEGTLRTYRGRGWRESIRLTARMERWNGSLGLYDPASSFIGNDRVLVEEGRLHFASVDEALRWMYVGSLHDKPVFTNNGLVFGYSIANPVRTGQGTVRSVAIWQIYINGRRPTSMPGADDNAIIVIGGSIPDSSEPFPAPVGYDVLLGMEPYDPHKTPEATTRAK